jgi:cytochrome c556
MRFVFLFGSLAALVLAVAGTTPCAQQQAGKQPPQAGPAPDQPDEARGQWAQSDGREAQPPAKDTIFARKILMSTIDMNMEEIETMLAPGGKVEVAEAREHADLISVLLTAFPHMFPQSTNQWKAGEDRDPALDTFASPDLWSKFAEFYGRAAAASKVAFEASRAATFPEFKARIIELRHACNDCHAAFLKTDR